MKFIVEFWKSFTDRFEGETNLEGEALERDKSTLPASSRTPAAAEAHRSKHGIMRFTRSQTFLQRCSPKVEPKCSAPGFPASRCWRVATISPDSSLRTMSLPLISRGGGGGDWLLPHCITWVILNREIYITKTSRIQVFFYIMSYTITHVSQEKSTPNT